VLLSFVHGAKCEISLLVGELQQVHIPSQSVFSLLAGVVAGFVSPDVLFVSVLSPDLDADESPELDFRE
jgi:hypothetical protein